MSNENEKAKLTYTSKLSLRQIVIFFIEKTSGEEHQITRDCDPVGFQL
jgi:hypothetical protein